VWWLFALDLHRSPGGHKAAVRKLEAIEDPVHGSFGEIAAAEFNTKVTKFTMKIRTNSLRVFVIFVLPFDSQPG